MGWVVYAGTEGSHAPKQHVQQILRHEDAVVKGLVGAMHIQAVGHALLCVLAGTVICGDAGQSPSEKCALLRDCTPNPTSLSAKFLTWTGSNLEYCPPKKDYPPEIDFLN